MSYTQVFGGTTIYPSDVSLLALALDADKALQWPLESNDPTNPAARIIDVTTTGSYAVTLPDATQTGAGQTILFNNLTASSNSFTVKDAGGSTIATVGVGEQWQVYLSGTATAAGTWRVFRYGASTATVQASALAGYGLTVTANTLSQSMAVTTFNSGPRTVLLTDRASALVWNGTGAGVLNLPAAASAANNFFIGVRNGGGGDLTVAASGSETIDGGATLTLSPGDSANVLTDGIRWYTLGLGQDAVFAFDYTSIPVTGGTYTLAGSELNRIAYKFQGALTADQYIVVPATIQQYWVDNATTGAFSLFLRTSGGTPVPVVQGGRGIYYCNGANVVDADTATISLPVSATDGGTGNTSYTVGDLLYANTPTSLAKLSDVAVGNALISGGVGSAPLWGKIGLTTHVSGTLPVANGGTGATTSTGSGAVVLDTSPTLVTPNLGTPSAATLTNATGLPIVAGTTGTLSVARGGTGATTSTGSGAVVLATSPTLVTPVLGAASATSISNGLGAVGTPSYSFTGDTNTGMWSPAADTLAFSEGGVEAMRIDSSGNVGIGTAAPSFRLDVHDSAANTVRSYCTDATGTSYAALSAGTASGVNSVVYSFSGAGWYGTTTNHPVLFLTNNTEKMRIDNGGNVGIGTTSPSVKLDVAGTSRYTFNVANSFTLLTSLNSSGAAFVDAFTNALSHTWQTSGVSRMSINSGGFVSISGVQLTLNGSLGLFQHDGTNMFIRPTNAASQLHLGGNNINVGVFENGGFKAAADNTFYLGSAGSRWTVVFATTGTINTSDERNKVWRGGPTDAELRAARRIIAELGFYQWADAVAEKGNAARLHFGVKAQQVWRIMAEEGLVDPISEAGLPGSTPYAFLCFDQWDAEPDVPAVEEVLDDDGNVIAAAMPARPGIEAGNRFGLRVDQLTLFLIAAQEARIAALEAAL